MARKASKATEGARRVVGYVRVSTDGQAESGLSLAAQRERLSAWCALYGAELVAVEVDAGASAKSMDGRPALAAALALCESGRADGVLVAKLDRLTRSVRDLGDLVERAARGGWALVSVAEQLDTATAAGRLVLHVLGAVAQWEREAIGERTSAALKAKRARGQRAGAVPLGYALAADGVSLVPCEDERAAAHLARSLMADGLSLRAVAARLSDAGHTPRAGGAWHPQTVARLAAVEVAAA